MGQEAQLSQRDLQQLGYSTLSGLSSFPKSQKKQKGNKFDDHPRRPKIVLLLCRWLSMMEQKNTMSSAKANMLTNIPPTDTRLAID